MRLATFLQQSGIGSRRACDALVLEGKVEVDGKKVLNPAIKIAPGEQEVRCAGQLCLLPSQPHRYYLLHKPVGTVCSTRGKHPVLSLIPDEGRRLFTCGRLDRATSGLLLITSDGDFCHEVMHPSKKIAKEYIAKVSEWLREEHLQAMRRGCQVEGVHVKPDLVRKVRKNTVKIVVHQGKKHEVRHIIASAGLETLLLTRVRIGGLQLGALPAGHFRPLKKAQIDQIFGR